MLPRRAPFVATSSLTPRAEPQATPRVHPPLLNTPRIFPAAPYATEMSTALPTQPPQRLYRGVDRYCWIVLIIAALGWMFDTMDQNIFNLVRKPSVTDLLRKTVTDPKQLEADARRIGGYITSIFLIGWSVGGFLFGIIGDRLGRTKTMIVTIMTYALFTGLSGLAT